jgi:hypothetical protein
MKTRASRENFKLNKGWRAFQTISSTLSARLGVLQVDWFLPDDLIPA